MRTKKEIQTCEWSHMIRAEDIEKTPSTVSISPKEDERKALIRRMGVLNAENIKAEIMTLREAGGLSVYLQGRVQADVTQACVVTLEPVHEHIDEPFEAWYADHESAVSLAKIRADRDAKGERPMMEEADDPESIVDGQIDIGELATQYLVLALNPYPHAEGAAYAQEDDGDKNTGMHEVLKNPFAELKEWKDRQR